MRNVDQTFEPCLRGCTIRNHHTDDCDGIDATGQHPCPGCEPRPAEYGLLCRSCSWRLDEWLSNDQPDAEWMAEPDAAKRREIRGSLAMAQWAVQTATRDGLVGVAYDLDKIGVTKEPPAPVNLARLDWLLETDDVVSSWLEAWVQHRGLSGPDVYELESACAYLAQWLDELAAWEPIAELWDELADLMRRGHALAPWRQQVRVCDGVPCPDCGEQALVVYGGDDVVTCYSCGGMQSRDSYERWVRLLANEARPKPLSHWVTEYGSTLKALQKRVERAEIPADGQDRNGRKLYYRDSLARILRAS